MPDKPPLFIVGSPRSGTTLLRNILNRHPSLAICGETRFFADVFQRRWVFGNLAKTGKRRRLVEEYLLTARIRRLGVDVHGLREKLLREATSYRGMFTGIMQYYADSQGKKRFGEKTPHHAFVAETLCEWYPGAAIIHLVRDPRDVVASLQRIAWAPKSIVSNALMWLLFNRAARGMQDRSGYMLAHYETLISQPEQELARICAHLGEDFAPSMLSADPVAGPYSWPRHAAGPITSERLHRWREQLTPEEVSLVEWIAGDGMRVYGYQRTAASTSIATVVRGLILSASDAARHQAEQLPHTWYYLTQPAKLATHEYWKYRHAWDAVFPGLPPYRDRKP
jgi:hypothetical protein